MNKSVATVLAATAVLSAVTVVGTTGTARAAVPSVTFVPATTAFNSSSPKIAVAVCPPGMAVLGGAAELTGGAGQVLIESAFPLHNLGALQYQFVVKAREDLTGTDSSWSVTAGAYCTDDTVPMYVSAPSSHDSTPIKDVEVECPRGTKVVGMGGQVSTSDGSQPAPTVGDLPDPRVVFQGFSVNQDLNTVTARATEQSGALGGAVPGNWSVTAVAACGYEYAFDGIEHRATEQPGGGLLPADSASRVDLSCTEDKTPMSMGATVDDYEMGQWYLDRFSRYNPFKDYQLVTEAYRNPELGTVLMHHGAYLICI
ncbi:MAG TPA: hypothetical protein VGX25_22940 [Actinophytocola sp.]|uniref:hypothetical protein n=1 Tax=Actinophytocola sp. TaxID=1872138 RepID=UPI002DDCB32C|nr:hypothetical protein [Actinophytocola sp.]HEV2782257.1 hypothetical protein [Actinophytocola sp.]